MLDWLNVKAWLSIAVIVLISAAGAWIDYENHKIEKKRFETYLDHFVHVVNDAIDFPGSLMVVIDFSDTSDADKKIMVPSTFNNQEYDIILTGQYAVFIQEPFRLTRFFQREILLAHSLTSTYNYENFEISTPVHLDDLDTTPILRSSSKSTFTLFKHYIESNGSIDQWVTIMPSN
jgi:hypothetical protein